MALVFGLLLNALGNSLTIVSGCGSGIWTAASVNIHELVGIDVGLMIFIFGIINALTNQVLIRHIDVWRFIEEMVFITFFSYFIQIFADFFTSLGWNHLSLFIRVPMALIGVCFFCTAISLYQRANLFMHPNDDTTNILRFQYLKGSAVKSQLLDFAPPIIIILICAVFLHRIYSVNIGTIFSIICNGFIIQTADKLIFPSLKHNENINTQLKERRQNKK
ncbi:hypothetical protein D7I45_01345 [Apilactobacillus bombintestini]|uniref:Sugar specific permease n=1 Tax=Apilactobacillus bombintestini TaxID=2419772 RepID=A0A387AS84_9LACO|nr:hypothetical protein D7I45_01345 [Apilactobacillus bombintestini]